MNLLRLHLWREWREHRMALLMLILVLPFVAWGVALVPPRRALADPLLQSGAALAFVVIVLVATGGELLGFDRRGPGLRWLERLPSGLNAAFLAKLLFLVLTIALAAVYGFGVARSVALLRGITPRAIRWEPISLVAAVPLVLWTFACSAWTLRGGLALLTAGLVLGVIGFPIWRVIQAGYLPHPTELVALMTLLAPSALIGAWLAFVRGGRHGRGTAHAALLGLAPALPVIATAAVWSMRRLAEHEAFDPSRADFHISGALVTEDGKTAFAAGMHYPDDWKTMPKFALRIDLETGSVKELGQVVDLHPRFDLVEMQRPRISQFLVQVAEQERPLVFDAERGEPDVWDPRKKTNDGWIERGLGHFLFQASGQPAVIRDPFRARDYPTGGFPADVKWGNVMVRPGRWLLAPAEQTSAWLWLDPDTNERGPVDWRAPSLPLVVLFDGRVLVADVDRGLRVVDPEHDLSLVLDSRGIAMEDILPNGNWLRIPGVWHCPEAGEPGPILLKTEVGDWLVIDEDLRHVRRFPVPDRIRVLRALADSAIVIDSESGDIERLHFASGALTPLWPTQPHRRERRHLRRRYTRAPWARPPVASAGSRATSSRA